MTGNTYQGSKYGKLMAASEAKAGKSTYLIASALGVLPWQKDGGIVDKPENLFVITFDTDALSGVKRFLKDLCGAPDSALNFTVYNLEDDVRKVTDKDEDYNMGVYNAVLSALQHAKDALAKQKDPTAVVHFASLTGLALAIERGVVGAPKGKGYSDASKWKALQSQLMEIQNWSQIDQWHVFWEAHIDKAPQSIQGDAGVAKETISVAGKAGRGWGINCSHNVRIRRNFGTQYKRADGSRSKIEETYIDTRPNFEFIAGGRNFTEACEPKEPCMTAMFNKLGLKVGGWKP